MDFREKALEIIRNKTALVICGGGVLGIAECGALVELESLGLDLKKLTSVCGSSVGSILSTSIACQGTSSYMKKILDSMDFNRFQDHDCFLRSAVQFIRKYGLNETTEIMNLAIKLITDLGYDKDITFQQLYDKTKVHLTLTYLSVNYDRTMYADHINEPNGLVRDAIVKSSSIPVFYEAFIEGSRKAGHVKCDGGTANNYPMNIPREQGVNPINILGLKLIASNEVDSIDNGGPGLALVNSGPPLNALAYIKRIVDILRRQALRMHVSENDWQLSIKINVGKLTSTDFNLTKEQQEWLFNQGKLAVQNYVNELAGLLESGKFAYMPVA